MNDIYIYITIKTGSLEQREKLLEACETKVSGCLVNCCDYSLNRKGDCDILFDAMLGGITPDEVFSTVDIPHHYPNAILLGGKNPGIYSLIDIPLDYPNVTVEVWIDTDVSGRLFHRVYKRDTWEDLWTIEDAAYITLYQATEFSPSMLELKTSRDVYDRNGTLILHENKIAPLPFEYYDELLLLDGYEEWKEDPIKWERERQMGEERLYPQ